MPMYPPKESSELVSIFRNLIEAYDREEFNRLISEYANKLNQISKLNQALQSIDPGGQKEAYGETVQAIMASTQDYYTYIAALPQDMRKFLLLAADVKGVNDGSLDEINALIGPEVTLGGTPPLSALSIRPDNYIMQIDAITNRLATLGGQSQIQVGTLGGPNGQPVTTTVTLDIPEHMKIEGGHVLTAYDKSIINGVNSLLESGNTVFSIPMLYHAMTGRQNPSLDDQLYNELSGKLEQMRRMMLIIDLAGEKEAHYITNPNSETLKIEEITLEGYLMPLNKVSGVINGKRAELYQILQHPPLYSYSKMKRQLASVHISLLSAPVNNNSTTIPLKTYLLQRIEIMKNNHGPAVPLSILFDSIYQELEVNDANKTKKMRIRNFTETILGHFKDQGYIKGYAYFKNGRNIAGINILL